MQYDPGGDFCVPCCPEQECAVRCSHKDCLDCRTCTVCHVDSKQPWITTASLPTVTQLVLRRQYASLKSRVLTLQLMHGATSANFLLNDYAVQRRMAAISNLLRQQPQRGHPEVLEHEVILVFPDTISNFRAHLAGICCRMLALISGGNTEPHHVRVVQEMSQPGKKDLHRTTHVKFGIRTHGQLLTQRFHDSSAQVMKATKWQQKLGDVDPQLSPLHHKSLKKALQKRRQRTSRIITLRQEDLPLPVFVLSSDYIALDDDSVWVAVAADPLANSDPHEVSFDIESCSFTTPRDADRFATRLQRSPLDNVHETPEFDASKDITIENCRWSVALDTLNLSPWQQYSIRDSDGWDPDVKEIYSKIFRPEATNLAEAFDHKSKAPKRLPSTHRVRARHEEIVDDLLTIQKAWSFVFAHCEVPNNVESSEILSVVNLEHDVQAAAVNPSPAIPVHTAVDSGNSAGFLSAVLESINGDSTDKAPVQAVDISLL